MKVGDLVRLKHRGNGHPNVGLIVEDFDPELGYKVVWDQAKWAVSFWSEHELVVISESR